MSAMCPVSREPTRKVGRSMNSTGIFEVTTMLLEEGEPELDTTFVGTQPVTVG